MNFGCHKCSGAGRINAFNHIASGRCFECGGTGEAPAGTIATSAASASVSYKAATFGRYGLAQVSRFGAGFRAELAGFTVWFDLEDRSAVNVVASDGFTGQVEPLTSAISAAVR